MSHYAKLEQYHQSIRKQELHDIFSQKRIQLLESNSSPTIDQEVNLHDINPTTLEYLAKVCQTEQGIQKIFEMRIQQQLEKYLSEHYLNYDQQKHATLIICNLHMIERPSPPFSDFTKKIMHLLEFGNFSIASNCTMLIFNIASDHPEWRQKIVNQYKVCQLLCKRFERQTCDRREVIRILGTLLKIVQGSFVHDSFRELMPIMVGFLTNPSCNDSQIVGHAFYCFFQLAMKFPQEATNYINNNNLLTRFIWISHLLKEVKFIKATLDIMRIVTNSLTKMQIINTVLPFVEVIMRNGYKGGNRHVKNKTYDIIIRILQDGKVASQELMGHKVGYLLLDHFGREEDAEVLHSLVNLFSIVIMNIDLGPLTQSLELLFERVEFVCPQEIEGIGFIKETMHKVKQKAALYL